MAAPDIEASVPASTSALPDYLVDPNAVLKDEAAWRYGRAPDYTNTRAVYEKCEFTILSSPHSL